MKESDLRSDVHYLGSSENKAWKKKKKKKITFIIIFLTVYLLKC